MRANDKIGVSPARTRTPTPSLIRIWLRFAIALLVLPAGFGLLPAASAQPTSLQVRLLDEEQGLDNLSITALAQDKTGYLWVATENGVYEYRGASFWEYGRADGLTDPAVYSLLVDSSGTLWAGTHSGLFWFANHRFHELRYQGRSLYVGMNSMLTATGSGEVILERDEGLQLSIERESSGPGWSAVLYKDRHPGYRAWEDGNGIGVNSLDQLVLGCHEGICDGPSRVYGPAQGAPTDYYVAIFRARDGRMWARGRKHIVTWRTGDLSVQDLTSSFPANGMHTIYRRFTEDAGGLVLTPTPSGFAAWDGVRWQETTTSSRGSLHGASAIFCDREGSVWIGTRGRGLLQSLGYGQWSNYGPDSGLSAPTVDALARDRAGNLWLGTEQSADLLAVDRATGSAGGAPKLTPLGLREDALSPQAFASSPDGGMWSGTLMGQLFHTDAIGRLDHRMSMDAYIHGLLLDPEGTLWLATNKGLFSVHCPQTVCSPTPIEAEGLTGRTIRNLAPDGAGGLWAVGSTGLFHVQHGGVTHVRVLGHDQNFDTVAPVRGSSDLWLSGEAGGLLRVRVTDASARLVEAHTAPELLSDRIQTLAIDRNDRLWIGTDHGVNVLDHGRLRGLTTEDGLVWNDVNSLLADADGSIWIGTTLGVSHLLHADSVLDRLPFRAAIERVQYGDGDLDGPASDADQSARWNAGITLVHFGAPTFRENQALIYHYQLAGFDPTPVTTHSGFARFARLPPGAYTFRVVAEDPVHHVFSSPAELHFTLTPPWWKSRWMFFLLVLLIFGAVNLVWHSSHKMLLAQQQKLERMVEIRTREIQEMALRDSLTGIMNRRAIMSRLDEEMDYARRHSTPLCIALLDLDHFKQINDTYGHLAGDEVLRQAAHRLASCVRTSDAIGRYGGEEFIVIFRNVDQEFGREHCERIRRCLSADPVSFGGRLLQVTCSVGLVWTSRSSDFNPGLLARADAAMYQAKQKGRNRVEYASLEPELSPAFAMQ